MIKTTEINRHMTAAAIRLSRGDRAFTAFAIVVVSILTLVVLLPMINVLSASFSSASAVNSGKTLLLPVQPTLRNYKTILRYSSVWLGYRNTIFYTTAGTAISVALTMVCAFPLSQRQFSGKKFFSILFFIPMIFSGGMIPSYMLVRDLKIMNTIWAVLLPGAVSIFNMIVARTFIQSTIPDSLSEAARIDGCSPARFFVSFVLPLSTTIIAVISMYYAVAMWNSYFSAFLYLNKRELYPLQLFLREILVNSQFDSSVMSDPEMAKQLQGLADTLKYVIIVLATLPLMMVYPFVQKYFIKGVMVGSVKG